MLPSAWLLLSNFLLCGLQRFGPLVDFSEATRFRKIDTSKWVGREFCLLPETNHPEGIGSYVLS